MPVRLEGGEMYETVAERVRKFRDKYPISSGWRLTTEIITITEAKIVCRGLVVNPEGHTVADGIAEEIRSSSIINKFSAVENCQTSAWGRALAAAGLGDGAFCSLDELTIAWRQQEAIRKASIQIVPGSNVQRLETQKPTKGKAPEQKPSPSAAPTVETKETKDAEEQKKDENFDLLPKDFPRCKGLTYTQTNGFWVADGSVVRNQEDLRDAGFQFSQKWKKWVKEEQGGTEV